MKAQLTIEYMISFGVFISLVTYIYLLYSGNIPNFINEVEKEHIRSVGYQLSELLINNPGWLTNWEDGSMNEIKMIGLSNETENKKNLISLNKVKALNDACLSDYYFVQEKLGLNETFSIYFYTITSTGERGKPLLNCKPSVTKKTTISATVRRITSFINTTDGTVGFGELIVEVS